MIAGRSISSRLTLWFSSVLLAGLVLFGAVMWFDLDQTLMAGRALMLDHRADRLSDLLRDIRLDSDADRASKFQTFAEATGGGLMQVLHQDGTLALPSPPSAKSIPWPQFSNGSPQRFEEINVGGQPFLVLTRPLSSGGEPMVLRVAATVEGNRPILRAFSIGLLWTVPALLALSALGGYLLSQRALKPVDVIIAATNSISVSNLSERLPVPQTGDELERLSETHNAMLARLETAVTEIKRFTADASHELRSPLSFVRTVAEVALRNQQTDSESRNAFKEIVEECGKASRLLEDMLTLARADSGNMQIAFETVDLGELATAVCDKARVLASARQHSVTISVDRGYHPILADYSNLRRLLWILLENAIKYTPAGGRIYVTVQSEAREIKLAVQDSGIGISATDLPHIFERFYRADPSRSQVEGAGLGLAIAKWIVDAHHARLVVESKQGAGSTFQVVFPIFREASGAMETVDTHRNRQVN